MLASRLRRVALVAAATLLVALTAAGSASAADIQGAALAPGGQSFIVTGQTDTYQYAYSQPDYNYTYWCNYYYCYSDYYYCANDWYTWYYGGCYQYNYSYPGYTSFRNPYRGGVLSVWSQFWNAADPSYSTNVDWQAEGSSFSIDVPLPAGRWYVSATQSCEEGTDYNYWYGSYRYDCTTHDSQYVDLAAAPEISLPASADVDEDSAAVRADVKTRGFDTRWHVEYGTVPGVYDHATIAQTLTATGNTNTAQVAETLSGLEDDTTYHWRLVATNAGGAERTADQTFTTLSADDTPPGITPVVTGTDGDNGWHTSDVAVSWTVTDEESTATIDDGCAESSVTEDTGADGVTFSCAASSKGGSDTKSVTVKRDATAPSISAAKSPEPNEAGWNNEDVTVAYDCDDAGSGIAACADDDVLTGDGADQTAWGRAKDEAGNTATASVENIDIDKTAPAITLASRAPAPNADGWNNESVAVTWACADEMSGAAEESVSQTVEAEGADQSATGTCTDAAGNSASATQDAIDIDRTAAAVTLTGGGTYTVDQSVTVACSATDTLSGVASDSCAAVAGTKPAYEYALGANELAATATDKAGNEGAAAATVTVLVTPDSLCALTKQKASKPGVADGLCAKLGAAAKSANANAKSGQLGAYRNQVAAQAGKAIAAADAEVLTRLSQSL